MKMSNPETGCSIEGQPTNGDMVRGETHMYELLSTDLPYSSNVYEIGPDGFLEKKP